MKNGNAVKRLLNISLVTLLIATSTQTVASGFQLLEYNTNSVGDAGAGGAAIADDASTGFINPAGLTRIKKPQIIFSNNFVMARSKFEGSSTWYLTAAKDYTSYTQSGIANGNDTAIIPAFHYALPLTSNIVFGLGVTVPFGLSTHYSPYDYTRYAATTSEITTIDVSPSIGYKINEKLSLGFGLDIERLTANLNSVGGLPGYNNFGDTKDSFSENEASDWGYGWHIGALYEMTPDTRIGVSYRSQVVFQPSGTSTLKGPLANGMNYPYSSASAISSSNLQTNVTLPPTTTLSIYHKMNDRLAVMGSAYYTQWNTIKSIILHNVASAKTLNNPSGLVDSALPQHYRNTWRFGIGANYDVTSKFMIRTGIGYDQTPTIDSERSLRLPDENRTLVSLGAHYQATKTVGLDVGYTHIFFRNANLNYISSAGSSSTQNTGVSKNTADLVGAQVIWNLG